MAEQNFSIAIQSDGIAVITIDVPGDSMNTLKESFAEEANLLFDETIKNPDVKGIVVISGKSDNFIAGANIEMLDNASTAQEASKLSKIGQAVFNKLENSKKPIVAAINGPALGGGFEFALACHARIATDDPKTAVGLPEVMLGLLPGSGGTQRLPRLIGIAGALDLMLTGRQVKAKKAKKMGLVDDVVPNSVLLNAALKTCHDLINGKVQSKRKQPLAAKAQTLALEQNPIGRKVLFDQVRKRVAKQTGGNYPAPNFIIESVEVGMSDGFNAGLDTEAKRFGELVMTPESQQLRNIYFATTEMKKDRYVEDDSVQAKPIAKLGMLGGGLMGAGISFVSLDKAGADVRIKDISDKGLNNARSHVYDLLLKRKKRGALSSAQLSRSMTRVSGTLDYSGFKDIDLIIEAVFEKLELKHQMVQEIEAQCSDETIFATNTSSLKVSDIASVSKRPENIIGMHYFSPVEKMPLLEIIVTDKTADWVVQSCVEFGRKQGKTVIVVKDSAGFYVNRVLGPYMNEAARMGLEGVPFDDLDKAMTRWGFPVGPIALMDEVGVDVASKVGPNLEAEFGERMQAPSAFNKLIEDGRLGKKVKKGFYLYEESKKKSKGGKQIDPAVYSLLGVTPNQSLPLDQIAERCILPFINEAVLSLEDGTIRSPRDGDIGAIFGCGFAPFRGGPFRYVDSVGADVIVRKLQALQQQHGDRFKPADSLVKMAESGDKFYQ